MTTDTTPTLSPAVDLDSLTPGQARRLVLLDVLAQIRSGRLVPAHDVYVGLDPGGVDVVQDAPEGSDLRQALAAVYHCNVCAKGALFLAHVAIFDRVPLTPEMRRYPSGHLGRRADRSTDLHGYFPPLTLELAEIFFEGWDFESPCHRHVKDVQVPNAAGVSLADRVGAFDARFPRDDDEPADPAGRLTTLVEHMLAHDGLLVPEALVPDDAVPAARGD